MEKPKQQWMINDDKIWGSPMTLETHKKLPISPKKPLEFCYSLEQPTEQFPWQLSDLRIEKEGDCGRFIDLLKVR